VTFNSHAEALARWQLLRQEGSNAPEAEAELYGFFQSFRPDGRGLAGAFERVAGGDELLQRLLDVYRVTAPGWEPSDAYFLVKAPQPLTDAALSEYARRHRDSMAQIASYVGEDELGSFLKEAGELVTVAPSDSTPASEGANLRIYEAAVDFMTGLDPEESEALLLGEAYYGIACDYFLKYHLLWPLYRRSSPLDEPFEAYSQLWKHGVQCDFLERGRMTLSVPTAGLHA
jgi:hypothetical protein